ncbi:MAG: hypothetical protein PHE06_09960 [Lachnospiraceae bacterium]|nr:hypothetical protein [Lachnospiraceae bacterium]
MTERDSFGAGTSMAQREDSDTGRGASMTETTHSGTGIFMTELILVILFFAIASSCCLQVFARASVISREAEELKMALNCCENLAEQLRASDGERGALQQYYEIVEGENDVIIYLDSDGKSCRQENASYYAAITEKTQDKIQIAQIAFKTMDGTVIYSLDTAAGAQ